MPTKTEALQGQVQGMELAEKPASEACSLHDGQGNEEEEGGKEGYHILLRGTNMDQRKSRENAPPYEKNTAG